jgi:hypothetical protein
LFLKIDSTSSNGPINQDFITAVAAAPGFADVTVDSPRIPVFNGALVNTDIVLLPFAGAGAQTIYTHHGRVPGSQFEGKPVAWRYLGSDFKVTVFDFPLFYMRQAEARAALVKALQDMGEVVEVEEPSVSVPVQFTLHQAYPNPFNPTTVIRYELPVRSLVDLRVYDILGREVVALVKEERPAGVESVSVDARGLASGVYFYRLVATPVSGGGGSRSFVRKMAVLR